MVTTAYQSQRRDIRGQRPPKLLVARGNKILFVSSPRQDWEVGKNQMILSLVTNNYYDLWSQKRTPMWLIECCGHQQQSSVMIPCHYGSFPVLGGRKNISLQSSNWASHRSLTCGLKRIGRSDHTTPMTTCTRLPASPAVGPWRSGTAAWTTHKQTY